MSGVEGCGLAASEFGTVGIGSFSSGVWVLLLREVKSLGGV